MLIYLKKIFEILGQHERKRSYLLIFLIFTSGLFEVVGVASIMPFMAVVVNPEIIEKNFYLNVVYTQLGFTDYPNFILFLGFMVFIILITSLSFHAFTSWSILRFSQMCNYQLSTRLLNTYFLRPYVWFLANHSADLGKNVLGEVTQVVNSVIIPAMNLVSRATASLFLLALIIFVEPMVALVTSMIIGGIYVVVFFSVRKYLVTIGSKMSNMNSQRFKIVQEGLSGIKEVKFLGLEIAYLERYKKPAQRFTHYQATQLIISDIPRYLLEAVAFGGMLGILLILLVTRPGGMSEIIPLIALYALAGYRLLPALQQVYVHSTALKFGSYILDKLHSELTGQKLHQSKMVPEALIDSKPMLLRSLLSLNAVSFRYPGANNKAIDKISLEIRANTIIGFVGPTGSGKTTIVDIILGLLKPDTGVVTIDGVELSDSNRRQWQNSIGYVPQHIFLIDDTLAANIAFGINHENIDMAAVEEAGRSARLQNLVSSQLSDGYQTIIGERGVRLSGGQRQRIGIARALYRNPSILIFDEATSALDNVTEQAVMDALEALGHKKTIIMIAHRLSTVRNCDQIFVMDNGRIVSTGTYDDLENASPIFRAMTQSKVK